MADSSLRLRLATAADLPALECGGVYASHRALIRDAFDRQRRGEAVMLVAEIDGNVVGQAWIDFLRRLEAGAALIWAVRVRDDARGRGIGRALIGEAEACIRTRGIQIAEITVEKHNQAARAWYERLGYAIVGDTVDVTTLRRPDGAEERLVFDQWRLQKPLSIMPPR